MLIKHLVFYILLNVSLTFYGIISREILAAATGQKLLENVVRLTDSLIELTPYINLTLSEIPPNCVQMLCKFVCFHGISTEIEQDILRISMKNKYFCATIEELRLYNYEFPSNKLSRGFLGIYTDKVDVIYLASSHITDIDAGAFAHGRFKEIYMENLHLKELKKDFFEGITYDFNKLSIIQKPRPLQSIPLDFLDYVKYQIKYLTLQAGLKSVHNLTAANCTLNNLVYMDFSRNDFGKTLKPTSLSSLTRIEHLDLSHSNLEYVPANLFAKFIATLEYLDLSYNKLKMISHNIFGWREIPHNLRIFAKGNQWSCSCQLQREMFSIFVYYRASLFCKQPEYYSGWSVFDDRICSENSSDSTDTNEPVSEPTTQHVNTLPTASKDDNLYHKNTTVGILTDGNSSITRPKYIMELNCLVNPIDISKRISHSMQCPLIVFDVIPRENSRVDVVVDAYVKPYDDFGLIWFNKVTTSYYKMAINYKEYGLGCRKAISSVTAVENLASHMPYTFCLVFKQQLNVSPFNCKSVQVGANLAMEQNAWLTRDMKKTGWCLVAFGIFLFLCAGMLMIYLLLKRKPILLKGSKRVKSMQSNNESIVVLPKKNSVRSMQVKEEKLASYGSAYDCQVHRRKSIDSEASFQSYINSNNLYEIIPPLERAKTSISISLLPNAIEERSFNNRDSDNCYLTPLESVTCSAGIVAQYAEIPCRVKRNSTDALPQVPIHQPDFSKELQNKSECTQIGGVYILDSQL